MKIFMGFTEIAGYYKHLKQGFHSIGIDCTFVDLTENRFKFGAGDVPNLLVKWLKWLYKRNSKSLTDKILKRFWWPSKALVFLWALVKFDVFIFGYNSSFLRFYDFPILKFFGKKIICVFHGSDSRPPYIDGAIMASKQVSIEQCIRMTQQKKKVIKKIDKYADVIISVPPQGYFHQRPFVLSFYIGTPNEVGKKHKLPVQKLEKETKVCIVHAPSAPEAKGTREIRQVINNLKNKGYQIELIELIGMPNEVVLEKLAQCDFAVDQLYCDCYMPGFATEAAWFGKPAVIGSYAKYLWDNVLPEDKTPPTCFCHPDEFEAVVEKLITDEKYRLDQGRRAREFVESQGSAKRVAEGYLRLIKGNIPEHWMYDPQDIRYVHGLGLSEKYLKTIIRNVIEQGGIEALQLSDKPELEQLFKAFAYSGGVE